MVNLRESAISLCLNPWVANLAGVGEEAGLDDFVVEAEDELLGIFIPEFFEKISEVGGVRLAGVEGDAAREIEMAEDLHAILADDFSGS